MMAFAVPTHKQQGNKKNLAKGPPLSRENWIDNQLLLCVNPSVSNYIHTNHDKQIAVPMNTVFNFESSLFKGQAIVRAVDLPNTNQAYFHGRNRKMDFTFQGQFKRRICFDRLYTGQIFEKPFTKLPCRYIISAGMTLLKALAPALRADINSPTPYMMSPLASAAQVFQICAIGKQRALPNESKEDVSLLDDKFNDMKWTERKAYFNDLKHLKEYYFEPGFVYTISCYSHMISPKSYSIHAFGMQWGMSAYLPSPMQIATVILTENDEKEAEEPHDLSKCEFLVNMQVWHTTLVDQLYPKLKYKKT